ncbi:MULTISPECIES: hypothetical protein [Rhizobium/Agrobacterium group]|uniref:hypothetical protein n=2 Tax=Rhizobiaceae TaxID=82115 RepID=UPI0008D1435C|nr:MULTISPECIES: hypothetical protein [Rhizobium/Agrobacterium group]MBY3257148.1 hypothetical protein [Rhizobium laguerreae]MBY3284495.1 hypothetical protein [Rhizobium laguerreae]MBY3290466.1 hypothetical protein [Rhizobium laguerreae]MBY3422530.1 hypothetical protein [Rhizobium laguerreae]MBY3535969.1 hypothetical protein [Rhizobium laguerreae]
MTRRRIQEVMPIPAVASSRQVEINQTSSILTDPDGRWVAKRQGAINEAFEKRMRLESEKSGEAKAHSQDEPRDFGISEVGKLSGESERIGRTEWDENTPFGKHVGFV